MTARNGKIARLPFEIREQLNHRLLENEPAKTILAWLNTQPAVTPIIGEFFEGRPVTEQNISEWRQGGYQEWLTLHTCLDNARDLSEDAVRVARTGVNAEHLLMVLTATCAELLKKWGTMPEVAFNRKLFVLQDLAKMALAMRRSEQRDARLEIDRQRLEVLRERQADRSPSSTSSRASSSGAHPLPPKAPEIRPSASKPPSEWSEDDYWTATGPNPYPNAFSVSQNDPPGAAGPADGLQGKGNGRSG